MIHSIAAQIEHLSTAFTLETGDLLATGTPEGVGAAMSPPVFLRSGDVARCEIDGIGYLENLVLPPARLACGTAPGRVFSQSRARFSLSTAGTCPLQQSTHHFRGGSILPRWRLAWLDGRHQDRPGRRVA